MASYRLTFLDTVTGEIPLTRDFEAESDQAAIAYADDARGMAPMELRHGSRLVKRWDSFPPPA